MVEVRIVKFIFAPPLYPAPHPTLGGWLRGSDLKIHPESILLKTPYLIPNTMGEVKIGKFIFAPPLCHAPSRYGRVRSSKLIQIWNLHYYKPHI